MPKGFSTTRRSKFDKSARAVGNRSQAGWVVDEVLVDDGDVKIYDEAEHECKIDFSDVQPPTHTHTVDTTVALLDIARPAKKKGIAKEFEVIKPTPKAPLLDDEEFEIWEDAIVWDDDDWEKIHDEQRIDTRPSYSSVLRKDR